MYESWLEETLKRLNVNEVEVSDKCLRSTSVEGTNN